MLALHDIRLGRFPVTHTFASGAITVVLGRNRSGKTRLCRLIAGLEPAAGGRIEIDDEDVTAQSAGERSVALVYQAFVNYPNLTAFENMASPLRARRRPNDEIEARVREIAGKLGIVDLLERRPDELSGGQQQRLAIGRALARSARVLVLDEPLVNLDYKLRESLEMELRAMLHGESLTVVYTTSDPRDAFNLADQVVLLEDHRILQSGAPLDVFEAPVSVAAADLMSDPGVNQLVVDGEVCALRPEQLSLQRTGGDCRTFELLVLTVETNGSETYLHGEPVGQGPGSHWVARLPGLHRIEAGEHVALHAAEAAILRFPAASPGEVPVHASG